MPFYIRKSLRFGPLRLNLSKSGVGVSAGIKGLRVGVGPRGTYVHAGRGGAYYRKTVSHSRTTKANRAGHSISEFPQIPEPSTNNSDLVDYEELESGSVLEMMDASAKELLEELNAKQEKIRLWPISAMISCGFIVWGIISGLIVVGDLGFFGLFILTPIVAYFDRRRKTTVVMYDLESDLEGIFRRVFDSHEMMKNCKRIWHIEGKGRYRDPKYHAGAAEGIHRKQKAPKDIPPSVVRTNISVPSIDAGKQILCFFPDRLLVFEKNRVGSVPYCDLQISVTSINFVEDEGVPSDARVVDKTWRFVNKRGGPDRRFKNNRELPVVLYEEIAFSSASGLREHFQISKQGVAGSFKRAIEELRVK